MRHEPGSQSTNHPPGPTSESRSVWEDLLHFGRFKRVPVVMQTEASECGMACVVMIASHHGSNVDLATLRSTFTTSLRGARLHDLIDALAYLGLASRALKVDVEHLNQLYLPCIIHWEMNHFVVLTRVQGRRLEIIDPAKGRRWITFDELGRAFTGVALEVDAGPKVKRIEKKPPISIRSLAGSISGIGRGLVQVFSLALLLELFALLAPQFMQITIDQVIGNADSSLLTFLGISFALLLIFRAIVESLRTWTVMWIGSNVSMGWTGNVFHHLLKLPLDYFGKRYLGDVLSRFGSINVIQQTLTTQFVLVILDGLMASLTAAVMFVYSPSLAAMTIGFAAVYAIWRVAYYRSLHEANQKQINVTAVQQSVLIESVRGIQTVRLNNSSSQRAAKFMNATADVLNLGIVVQKINLKFDVLSTLTTGSQRIAVLWFGATLVLDGHMTAGMLMAFVIYSDQFTNRFVGLANYAVQFKLLHLHGERLSDIVLTPPEAFVEGTHEGELTSSCVSFKNVSFRYSYNSRAIVDSCSFEVADGEIVAIVGTSGSGKSTLAKLLLGALDYQSGQIYIGGVDMPSLGKRRVRDLASCVLQEDQVFSGTILENISFFDPNVSVERVMMAADKASISAEVEQMPMGYRTLLGDMGSSLSSGQQQRLLLARAFYREPKILVLDEATSHLDPTNERAICDAIRASGITTLLIAHRPAAILAADRVLRMDRGRLFEVDKHTISNYSA